MATIFKANLTKWNGKAFRRKLSHDMCNKLVLMMAEDALSIMKEECPVDTGNLRDSHIIEGIYGYEGGEKVAKTRVGVDEAKAPYAPFVYYPGVTRNYAGNDWVDRTVNRMETVRRPIYLQWAKTIKRNLTI